MKVLFPLCLVLFIVGITSADLKDQPLPNQSEIKQIFGQHPEIQQIFGQHPEWKNTIENHPEWKDVIENHPDWKEIIDNHPEWKGIFDDPPESDDGSDDNSDEDKFWMDKVRQPDFNRDYWKHFINQPLPNNDWKDLLHHGDDEGDNGDNSDDSHSGNDDRHGGKDESAGTKVENMVNKIWQSSVSDKPIQNHFCNESNSTSLEHLEGRLLHLAEELVNATSNVTHAIRQYQDRFKDFSDRQKDLHVTKDTLHDLLDIDSDSLVVNVIGNQLQSSLQEKCDQYDIGLDVLNTRMQLLRANIIQTCSLSYQNRIMAIGNDSKKYDKDYENIKEKISGLISDLDACQSTVKTINDLYKDAKTDLNDKIEDCKNISKRVSSGIFRDVKDVRQDLITKSDNTQKIVKDFSDSLPHLHDKIISSNTKLNLVDKFSLDIEIEVDNENFTTDDDVQFDEDCKKIIRGLAVYRFEISGDSVNVEKVEKKQRGISEIQKWVASFESHNDSKKHDIDVEIDVNVSDYDDEAENKTMKCISDITKGGRDLHESISRDVKDQEDSNDNFIKDVDNHYKKYLNSQDDIDKDIESSSKSILGENEDEEDIAKSIFHHSISVLNHSKITLDYQRILIKGRLIQANITVLQLQLNISEVINEINNSNDSSVITKLKIKKEVLTGALTQALRTLVILEGSFENCSSSIEKLDDDIDKAENETSEHTHRLMKKEYASTNEIRKKWREEKDDVRKQFRSSFQSLLNCTINSDSIDGLDDNTTGLSLKWNFHFDLSPNESIDTKIKTLQSLIPNIISVRAICSKDSIKVNVKSSSKRAAGDVNADASVSSNPSTTSSSNNNPGGSNSNMAIIIGCVVGGVVLIVLIVVIALVMKKGKGERV